MSEPILEKLSQEGVISADDKKLILALVRNHELINILHYGEGVPQKLLDRLASDNIAVKDYLAIAPLLYLADVGGVSDGRLTNTHLRNAEFLSNEENLKKLADKWDVVRLFAGFLGSVRRSVDAAGKEKVNYPVVDLSAALPIPSESHYR